MILQTTSRGNSYSVDPIAQSVSAHLRAISPALHAPEAASKRRSAPLDLEALYPQIFGASATAKADAANRRAHDNHRARPATAFSTYGINISAKRVVATLALALALIGGIAATTVASHHPAAAAACGTPNC